VVKEIEKIKAEILEGIEKLQEMEDFKELVRMQGQLATEQVDEDDDEFHCLGRRVSALLEDLIPDQIRQHGWIVEWCPGELNEGYFSCVYYLCRAVQNNGSWWGTGGEASLRGNMQNDTCSRHLSIGLDGYVFEEDEYFEHLETEIQMMEERR
jgi:hypothetical protein